MHCDHAADSVPWGAQLFSLGCTSIRFLPLGTSRCVKRLERNSGLIVKFTFLFFCRNKNLLNTFQAKQPNYEVFTIFPFWKVLIYIRIVFILTVLDSEVDERQ